MPRIVKIVGAFYRPPAKSLLAYLPLGTPLELRPELENPSDPKAIAVYLGAGALRVAVGRLGEADRLHLLEEALLSQGFTIQDLEGQDQHLGYLPAEVAKRLHFGGPQAAELSATVEGHPAATFAGPEGASP